MFGRTRRKLFFFMLILCLLFFTPDINPLPVMAAEEEEEDNFTTMPNYRWENQSVTDSDVQEELIGDQYFINNTNAGSGTQKFAKSRKLSSRDFYFESRFALDIGSNVEDEEYWTDAKGNISNFDDGSAEDWEEGVNIDFFGVASYLGGYWLRVRGDPGIATINATGLNINATKFTRFVFHFMAYMDNITRIRIFDSDNNLLVTDNTLYLQDNYYLFNESLSGSSWTGTETEISIELQGDTGEPGFYVNYTYLYSPVWSEYDGFKFSLLNADDEEGMAFQFTRGVDLNYDISIDMYKSTGIALDYDYSFNYSINEDGWLRLRVDWHLDKKNVKIQLKFDNGTDIINIRRITDLYGDNLGFHVLLLLEEGFPSLCINNSVGAIARSLVYIDYIDADWDILEWREPSGNWVFEGLPGHTAFQGAESSFTAISPYGCTMYKKDIDDVAKWYQLNVDRFDGISFEYNVHHEDLENNDDQLFDFAAYNVHRNGSLEPIFRFQLWVNPGTPNDLVHYILVYSENQTYPIIDRISNGVEDCQGAISIYYESSSKMVLQHKYSDANDDFQETLTGRPLGEELFTKEMVFILSYHADTNAGGAADDIVEISIGAFELNRKDIIQWLVGTILGPFFDLIGILFSPFILLFQMLTLALVKGLKNLGVFLEPFFDALGNIFSTTIGAIIGIIDEIFAVIEDLWVVLETIVTDILDELITMLGAILDEVFVVLGTMISVIIEFIAAAIFWIWDELNLPDLLSLLGFILDYVTEFTIWLLITAANLVVFFLSISWLFVVGWWVWAVFIQWARAGFDPFGGLGNFVDAFFNNIIPVEIFGFRIIIPQGIVFTLWLIAILPADFALFTAMSS